MSSEDTEPSVVIESVVTLLMGYCSHTGQNATVGVHLEGVEDKDDATFRCEFVFTEGDVWDFGIIGLDLTYEDFVDHVTDEILMSQVKEKGVDTLS